MWVSLQGAYIRDFTVGDEQFQQNRREGSLYSYKIFYCFPPKCRCIENEASKQKRECFILDARTSRRDTVENFYKSAV